MELNEAIAKLKKSGYIVEKIDPNGGPTYRTREGITTNKPANVDLGFKYFNKPAQKILAGFAWQTIVAIIAELGNNDALDEDEVKEFFNDLGEKQDFLNKIKDDEEMNKCVKALWDAAKNTSSMK